MGLLPMKRFDHFLLQILYKHIKYFYMGVHVNIRFITACGVLLSCALTETKVIWPLDVFKRYVHIECFASVPVGPCAKLLKRVYDETTTSGLFIVFFRFFFFFW